MSKLEELIQKLCPDGVEYKMFPEVCQYIRGITYNKSKEAKTGDLNAHKVLRANNITLSTNTLNFDDVKLVDSSVRVKKEQYLYRGDILICAGSGSKEHIGKVAYISEDLDYTFGGFMAVIRCDKTLMSRFLFHILTGEIFKKYLDMALNSSTINNLNMGIMKDFQIPVPTLEVQQEIVRILDSFTKLTTELTTELTAELTARKRQYEFYRDEMLTFENDAIEYKPIKDCVLCIDNIKWAECPSKTFQYIDLSSVDRDNHCINKTSPITMENAPSRAQQLVQTGDVLIGTTRPLLKRICVIPAEYNHEICSTGFCVLRPNQKMVLSQWLYYVTSSTNFFSYVEKNQQGASYPSISDKKVKEFNIPVPSIKDQQKLIETLNNFDTLCNGLSSGLPAEIEARQKQYEYYRDKLLTFKKLA